MFKVSHVFFAPDNTVFAKCIIQTFISQFNQTNHLLEYKVYSVVYWDEIYNFPTFERQPTYCKIDKIDNIIWKPVLQTFSLFGRIIALLWFETWVMISFSWSLSDSIWATPPARDRSHTFYDDVLRFRPRDSVLRWHVTRGHVINYWNLAARAVWRCNNWYPGLTRVWVGEEGEHEPLPLDLFLFSGNSPFSDVVLRFILSLPTICVSGIRKQQFICGHLYNNS